MSFFTSASGRGAAPTPFAQSWWRRSLSWVTAEERAPYIAAIGKAAAFVTAVIITQKLGKTYLVLPNWDENMPKVEFDMPAATTPDAVAGVEGAMPSRI